MSRARLLPLLCLCVALPALAEDPPPASPPPTPPTVSAWSMPDTPATGYAILNIDRQGMESGSQCDVEIYVRGRLITRLQDEGAIALNLPPGTIPIRLATAGNSLCHGGMEPLQVQNITLHAGEVRTYRVVYQESGLYLMQVNTP
ncbi:MAG: hypothetical protein GAK43_01577 [Stenotrophomonas maltophilia]|nr:MAG: hypothetical protein GAK43_01577 [Stenotrophomonas maltophilia]